MSNEIALMKEIAKLQGQIDALRTIQVASPYIEDLRFPAVPGLFNPVSAKPDYDYTNKGFLFDASSEESIYIIAQMPHDWVVGSIIYPHVHWMPTSTNTGNVYWVMSFKWTNIDDTDAGSNSISDVVVAANGTAYNHQQSNLDAIAGTGKTSSSIISIRLYRNSTSGDDTYTGEPLLKEFDIHYWKDPTKTYWTGSVA
jgi:hypothetical protein